MTTIVTIGIDLAKNVFAVHGVDATGKPTLVRHSLPQTKLLELIASLPSCLIGMEAFSGAHHWAREFQRFGHTVRLMAPKFVIPYRLGQAGQERCGRRRCHLRSRHPTEHALRADQVGRAARPTAGALSKGEDFRLPA